MKTSFRLSAALSTQTLPEEVAAIEITGITLDSRNVVVGDLFIALKGHALDGQKFVADAVAKGAVAILVEAESQSQHLSVAFEKNAPVVSVWQLSQALSGIAGVVYDQPSAQMNLIGVTGTNGKTTCVNLLASLALLLGRSSASIGTMGVKMGDSFIQDFSMTTPDAITCQKALAQLSNSGVSTVAMEVSSHGLAQHRVQDLQFKAAIFTNLTHDHLDYHKTVNQYAEAKRQLFARPSIRFAIINLDDSYSEFMRRAVSSKAKIITYSLQNSDADVFACDLQYLAKETQFKIVSQWGTATVRCALMGEFNVYNLVAVIATLCAQGASFEQTILMCSQLQPVAGRMQLLNEGSDVNVVVDYAHTPDALQKSLSAVRQHTQGDLWCVFGCGGDRDKAKRPLMAAVAESIANHVIVTTDNPRTESAVTIIEDICEGFVQPVYSIESSRERAIQIAVQQAGANDTVLIAGKGHEKYQAIGDQKIPFDDFSVAQKALVKRAQKRRTGGVA